MQSSPYESPYQAAAPQMEYVSVGPRLLATIIDSIIIGVVIGIISTVFRSTAGSTLGAVIAFVYFIVMEATQGATIGKKVLGLRVVKEDGTPISWSESIIRNLLRIVDEVPFFIPYLLGAILVWNSPTRQRLGDRIAKTVVIRSR